MDALLDPRQLVDEGQSLYQRGDYSAAARAFQAAGSGFLTQGKSLDAAEMANNASVALLKAGDAPGALRAVEGTDMQFAQAGDLRRQGLALGNLGAALEGVNCLPEALEAYQQSAELLQQVGEKELRAHVMQSLSALQLRMGKPLEAYGSMYAGVHGMEKPKLRQKLLKTLMEIPFKLFNRS
ncbi:MAG: hypothetical protein JW726_14000 [Anaerolineales bacterium]|nr:hypothetical protein [Anaerolineales bacterium]